jgi:hypothetical protein
MSNHHKYTVRIKTTFLHSHKTLELRLLVPKLATRVTSQALK